MTLRRQCCFLLLLLVAPFSLGFVSPSVSSAARAISLADSGHNLKKQRCLAAITNFNSPRRTSNMRLYADTGGMKRGAVLFGIVLLLNIWAFSIPPEFRRAKLCTEEQSAIYTQCQTPQQWTQGVKDYYKNGGGIKFDFSIDPATLQENEELRNSLFNK